MEEDILESLFSGRFGFDFGMGGAGSRRPRKGEDSIIPCEVTLEDLYNGKSIKLMMEREIVCHSCKGYAFLSFTCKNLTESSTGAKGKAKPKKCVRCDGKGWSMTNTQV
jgi:DnaJ family protein A protein 2